MLNVDNNRSNIEINGIQFNDTPNNLSSSFLLRLLVILDGDYELINYNSKENIFNFGGNKFYDISGSTFVIEYDNKGILESDKNLIKHYFVKDGFSSRPLEESRQIPEILGYFEYKGKYYLILESLNKKTDEVNEDLGIFKGIVLNPSRYYRISDDSEHRIKETGRKVDEIL